MQILFMERIFFAKIQKKSESERLSDFFVSRRGELPHDHLGGNLVVVVLQVDDIEAAGQVMADAL